MSYESHPPFQGASADVVRSFIYGEYLPPDQKGYIVARYALAFTHKPSHFHEYADYAMQQLVDEETAGQHVPPLSPELTQLATDILENDQQRVERVASSGYLEVKALVLSAIIHHGSQKTRIVSKFDKAAHARVHRDPEFKQRQRLADIHEESQRRRKRK